MRAEPAFISRPSPPAAASSQLRRPVSRSGSKISDWNGSEDLAAWNQSIGVKNTFIHVRDEMEEEDDLPRRLKSGPVGLSSAGSCPSEPAWVPLPMMPASVPVVDTSLDSFESPEDESEDDGLAHAVQSNNYGSEYTIKNTFIHYDDDDQPNAFTKKSVSGPAYFDHVGEEFAMAATLEAARKPAPPAQAPPPAPSAPGATSAPGAGALPSVGSVGHATGTCRPCAHNWRPGGCVKGHSCTFCHACEEGALKQRKKEKVSRIRAEKRAKAQIDENQEDVEDDVADPHVAPASSSSTPPPPFAIGPRHSAVRGSGQLRHDEVCPQPMVGEIAVDYIGGREECMLVRWSVDLRKLRQQHRCGTSRRFALRLHGMEVPFLFNLVPDTSSSLEATFQKPDDPAVLQVKCTDPRALPPGIYFRVEFAAGSLPPRLASARHDFCDEPLCAIHSLESVWDLATASGRGATSVVVQVRLSPAW